MTLVMAWMTLVCSSGCGSARKILSTHSKISDLAVEVRERADMLHQLGSTDVAERL
jgi:hypothetical protein